MPSTTECRPGQGLPMLLVPFLVFAGGTASPNTGLTRDLTFTSWGGAFQEAESKSYIRPFVEATGTPVIEDNYSGELARIRSQVESGVVSWDIVNVSGPMLTLGCQQGLFELLDWSEIAPVEDFLPVAVHECGVGMNAGATVLTYDADTFPAGGPTSWADMWDLETFPGTRGFRNDPVFTLEAALLADNVPAEELYAVLATEEGVNRAFAKLDEIKPNIRWWTSGGESVQLLAAGEYAVASVFYGRVFSLNNSEGRDFQIVRGAGTFQEFSYYAILSGTPNLADAVAFLEFASRPEQQAAYTAFYPYGPGNRLAYDLAKPSDRANLLSPVGADASTIFVDSEFWVANSDRLQQRFAAWQAQ